MRQVTDSKKENKELIKTYLSINLGGVATYFQLKKSKSHFPRPFFFFVCLEVEYFHFEGVFVLDKFSHPKLSRSPHNSAKQRTKR